MKRSLNLVIGVSGASGALFGAAFLRAMKALPGRSSLIVSPAGLRVYNQEMETAARDAQGYLAAALQGAEGPHEFVIEEYANIGARPASGSAPYDGMVVLPCSMKTLSGIANGYTANLIERAADAALKERRRVIVCPREAPYSLIHLRNMTALTEAGGIVLPISPGYYQKPGSFEDLGKFIAGRILSLFGIEQTLFRPWEGE